MPLPAPESRLPVFQLACSPNQATSRYARLLYIALDFVYIFFEKKVCIVVPALTRQWFGAQVRGVSYLGNGAEIHPMEWEMVKETEQRKLTFARALLAEIHAALSGITKGRR